MNASHFDTLTIGDTVAPADRLAQGYEVMAFKHREPDTLVTLKRGAVIEEHSMRRLMESWLRYEQGS